MPKTDNLERVKVVCIKHGELGEMTAEEVNEGWYAKLQREHEDIFSCTGTFTIIPVVAAIVENIVEKKSE